MSGVVQDSAMPASLSSVIKKISNYKVNTAKLLPDSSSSVSAGGEIRLRLPSNSIIDFTGLMMHATNTIATATCTSPCLEAYISRLELRMGGENILSLNNYGDIFHILTNASMSTGHQETRKIACPLGPRNEIELGVAALLSNDADKEVAAAVLTTTDAALPCRRDVYQTLVTGAYDCVASTWLGVQDLGVLDMSLLPQTELVLTFAPNSILSSTTSTYALSNVFFTVPIINFPQWSSNLLSVIQPDPMSGMAGAELAVKFKNYTSYVFGKSATDTFSHKFAISTNSLDRIWFSNKNAYTTRAAKAVGSAVPYYIFSDTDTGVVQYLQLFVDEVAYSQYRRTNYSTNNSTQGNGSSIGFSENLRELKQHNNNQYDCVVESASEFSRTKWYSVFDFTARSGPDEVSGMSTMCLSSNIHLDLSCTAAMTAVGNHFVFAETSQILYVGAGRNVRLER